MAYATAQDFIEHFGEREALALSDRERSGQIDVAVLERLLELASDEANGYVGRRYALPLMATDGTQAGPHGPLRLAVLNLARYHGVGTEIANYEEITARYKTSVQWLQGIADGRILLGNNLVAASAGGAAPTGGPIAVRTGERLFSSNVLGGML